MAKQIGMNPLGEFYPKTFLAGDLQRVTEAVTLKGGSVYPAGALLGRNASTGICELANTAAGDGTQTLFGVRAEEVDATDGDAAGVAYLTGEFALDRVTPAPGSSSANFAVAGRGLGIFFKSIGTHPDQ